MRGSTGGRMQKQGMSALVLTMVMVLAVGSPGMMAFGALPDKLSLTAGSRACFELALPVSTHICPGETAASVNRRSGGVEIMAGAKSGSADVVFKLMGILPIKRVELSVADERMLIPGGQTVGIALETQGLIVVGMSDLGTVSSPARMAGIKPGDVITCVNGTDVVHPEELISLLDTGIPAELEVMRGDMHFSATITPVSDPRDGFARIGAWVRSSTAGVGTLTYIDPETQEFGALGHAIADIDTGVHMPLSRGAIYKSGIAHIRRGESGIPGELAGDFLMEPEMIGSICKNTQCGIFGDGYTGETDIKPLPVAAKGEVHTGSAQILSQVRGSVESFECTIEQIRTDTREDMRALVLHITDEALIETTGGIVQGMSGSPIIQDGKLVGAVTHVLVNDPTRGYGIFIENMLDAAS